MTATALINPFSIDETAGILRTLRRLPMHSRGIQLLIWIFLLIFTVAPGWAQTDRRLSAREIFYTAPPEEPAKKPAPPQAKKAKPKAPVETVKSENPPVKSGAATGSAEIVKVSYSAGEDIPLGLRYSILKREGSGFVEADVETKFHSGDRIKLRVEVNTSGYMYVVNRGSSGNWKPLFPSSEIAAGDNRVHKGSEYDVPPGYVFTFDEQAGKENLFIVFSRQPVKDLEELIYSLSREQKSKEGSRPDNSKLLIAQANIQDNIVERLRALSSRDLIVEKVDESAGPPPSKTDKEKAVYVVNPSRATDARVVADLTLSHQ
jgi:hypothetical protein